MVRRHAEHVLRKQREQPRGGPQLHSPRRRPEMGAGGWGRGGGVAGGGRCGGGGGVTRGVGLKGLSIR